ncbi:hypothetical protein FPV67DRAFT_1083094 [Lyophyllum atratum]|nr:hypothetical protein FPV67DRAFT_1083094 [Lyophyllum atratum]
MLYGIAKDRKVDTVSPRIRKDIVDHARCDMESMLGLFLRRCLEKRNDEVDPRKLLAECLETVLPICNDPEVRQLMTQYCGFADEKQTRYSKFVFLFNLILEKIDKLQTKTAGSGTLASLGLRGPDENEIMFHCNDPTEISSTHSNLRRKPDIGIVPLEHAMTCFQDVDEYDEWDVAAQISSSCLEPKSAFQWDHFFSILEFNLTENNLAQPPPQYTTALQSVIPAIQDINHLSPKNEALNQKRAKPSPASAPDRKRTAAEKSADRRDRWFDKLKASTAAQTSREPRIEKRLASQDDAHEPTKRLKLSQASSSTSDTHHDDDYLGKSPVLQCAMYAAEMLCRGIYTTHAITILVADEMAWIWWFDRQGAIQTSGIDIIRDLPYFVVLLVAFQRFNKADWGIIEQLYTHPGYKEAEPILGVELEVEDKIVYANHRGPLSSHYSLVGRGTRVLMGTGLGIMKPTKESYHEGKALSKFRLAVKFSWPEARRQNEAEIIQKALSINNNITRGHLPNLIAFNDLGCSTADIRRELDIFASPSSPRLLRVLLLENLVPNDEWRAPATFMRLWVEWYQCHRVLWLHDIRHGDISLGNLMVNPQTKMGVLNDFDLAVFEGHHTIGGERTGTVPFMAIDLLTPEYYDGKVERRYRHDLESFIWVLVVVTLEQSAIYEGSLKKWQTGDYITCRDAKSDFVRRFKKDEHQEKGVAQSQRELLKALVKWLANRWDAPGPPYAPPSDHSEEDLDYLRGFEDVVAGCWSKGWPDFKRLTPVLS